MTRSSSLLASSCSCCRCWLLSPWLFSSWHLRKVRHGELVGIYRVNCMRPAGGQCGRKSDGESGGKREGRVSKEQRGRRCSDECKQEGARMRGSQEEKRTDDQHGEVCQPARWCHLISPPVGSACVAASDVTWAWAPDFKCGITRQRCPILRLTRLHLHHTLICFGWKPPAHTQHMHTWKQSHRERSAVARYCTSSTSICACDSVRFKLYIVCHPAKVAVHTSHHWIVLTGLVISYHN